MLYPDLPNLAFCLKSPLATHKFCRGAGKDCDYIINSRKEIVAFPLSGSVAFSGPIWQPGEKPGFDPIVSIKTVKLPLGGGCQLTDLEENFWNLPGVQVDGNRVTWNITAEEFQETQKTCFGYGDRVLFNMNVTGYLKADTGEISSVTASYSNDADVIAGAGAFKMDPMQVYYGCLAADTEVTLAESGHTLKIDSQALIGKRVATRSSLFPMQVAGNAYGFEAKDLLRITTNKERSVVLTEDHPIWINGRFINAIDTRLHDEVQTADGPEKVVGLNLVSTGDQPAKVWNIFLERAAAWGIAPIEERGFYANGILVGDGSVQEYNLLWEANAACRGKTAKRAEAGLAAAVELQPQVTEAVWDAQSEQLVVKWTVTGETPALYSFILTTITGNVQENVGEVPSSQRCAAFASRTKPDFVIVTGSDGTSPIGKPSSPPTAVGDGTVSCTN